MCHTIFLETFYSVFNEISPVVVTHFLGSE